ncbi:hypothetical protein HGRIS_007291 [Hohenbuehelia grisea]|uniref:BTB domain-containing protein n=1 Tax=Hohenbuehelia grisea TaxID=104357 RepID=A0ABR3J4A9_9AGAR
MLSPAAIQHHLYLSFLDGSTADVALHVRGSWNAVYRLHRVVLIQSGFFRSLFTAGFAESSPRRRDSHIEELNIGFDDHNITRAAFEVCISRLYGGGPPLHLDPSLVPTVNEPLTPSFPVPSSNTTSIPDGHQPASPCFLLSLLATSLYLSIPSIAAQALHMILNTVGPWTVLGYWRFATGQGIDWESDVSRCDSGIYSAAVGLENVAQLLDDESDPGIQEDLKGTVSDFAEAAGLNDLDIRKEPPAAASPSPSSSATSGDSSTHNDGPNASGPSFHYGVVSDKIGEAVVCWLARWGVDMFAYEQRQTSTGEPHNNNTLHKLDRLFTQSMMPLRKRANTVSTDSRPSSAPGSAITAVEELRYVVPSIFGRGGLDAKWIAALVSADTLFIRGERERYDFAKSVVELRRKQSGIVEEEEEIWSELFRKGIYYANMTISDLMFISEDTSPITGRPYVPLQALQSAHWAHSVQKHLITKRTPPSSQVNSPSPDSPLPKDLDLGLAISTANILAQNPSQDAQQLYYPVHSDASMRVGDSGVFGPTGENNSGSNMTMEQLFSMVSNDSTAVLSASTGNRAVPLARPSTSESTFFGLHPSFPSLSDCPHGTPLPLAAADIPSTDPTGKLRWTPYPPYRFAVEFWDIDFLKEKCRLHSHTIWHAGSLFNVYVQVVRKKSPGSSSSTMQVGVYLHRQSSVEGVPGCSRPSPHLDLLVRPKEEPDNRHHRGPSLPPAIPSSPRTTHYSPSIHPPSRSSTPNAGSYSAHSPSAPSSPTGTSQHYATYMSGSILAPSSVALPATSPSVAPPQPYRDPRSSIKAYFTICCASGTGTAQTRFSSAPDDFAVSQSWGWKSSSLTLRVSSGGDGEGHKAKSAQERPLGKEVSLRATVVLGLA